MLDILNFSSNVYKQEKSSLDINKKLADYKQLNGCKPLLICGDAISVLKEIDDNYFDCCMTSPPYWSHREYSHLGIGLEDTYQEYINNLIEILVQVRRVLKPTGSLWLNIGDTYLNKNLIGIPWRVTFRLTDEHGFILRNNIIWHKVKGAPDNSKDKLRCVHEHLFHFVKSKSYFYDIDKVRTTSRSAKVENGKVISATGVSGIRYKRQIELSTVLSTTEKQNALVALEQILEDIKTGKLSDFRMIIRGQQRTTHSSGEKVSGRARELKERGFYFLKYHPKGTKPGDVWDILPEDTQKREGHYAAYPEDLCKLPIIVSCPANGIVLDPFCGTGSTMKVAQNLGYKSVGIDISKKFLNSFFAIPNDILNINIYEKRKMQGVIFKTPSRIRWVSIIADFLLLGMVVGPLVAPFLAASGLPVLPIIANIIYFMGHHVCPQPTMGVELAPPFMMAVCMRCYGTVTGLFVTRWLYVMGGGKGFYWLSQYGWSGAAMASVLMMAYPFELAAQVLGWWDFSNYVVTPFGLVTGLAWGLFAMPILHHKA